MIVWPTLGDIEKGKVNGREWEGGPTQRQLAMRGQGHHLYIAQWL